MIEKWCMVVSDQIIIPQNHSTQQRNGYKPRKLSARWLELTYLEKRKCNKTIDRV
jgi:hypothetical protein